jgi:hypothetical protein
VHNTKHSIVDVHEHEHKTTATLAYLQTSHSRCCAHKHKANIHECCAHKRNANTHNRCAHIATRTLLRAVHAHCSALCTHIASRCVACRRRKAPRCVTLANDDWRRARYTHTLLFTRISLVCRQMPFCPKYADVPGGLSGRRSQTQEESGGLGPARIPISVQVGRA